LLLCCPRTPRVPIDTITACILLCHANGSNSDRGCSCLGSLGNSPTNTTDYYYCCAAQRAKARAPYVNINACITSVCHVNDSNSERGCSCLGSLDHTPTQKTDKFCCCAAKKAKARAATVTITAFINSVCHVNDSNSDRGCSCLSSLKLIIFLLYSPKSQSNGQPLSCHLCLYIQTLPMQMSLYV
jgi:hypothetical protein